MPLVERQREIRRRRRRRATLKRLHQQLAAAKNAQQRQKLTAKVQAVSVVVVKPEK